jgi:hypothetical protein
MLLCYALAQPALDAAGSGVDIRALILALISIGVVTAAALLGTLARRRDRRARDE